MANLITRTVTTYEADITIFKTDSGIDTLINYPIDSDDSERELKRLRKALENDTLKIVAINSIKETSKLYGCTESDFLSIAVELDPKTRRPIEQ